MDIKAIEDNLGCPIDVLLKALKEGIIPKYHTEDFEEILNSNYKRYNGLELYYSDDNFYLYVEFYPYGDECCGVESGCNVSTKDFNKTWWIDKPTENTVGYENNNVKK